jgi:hypothetical protein
MGVNDSRDRVGRVVKSVHKLKAESHKQSYAKQDEWHHRFVVNRGQVPQQALSGVDEADDQDDAENDHADLGDLAGRRVGKLGVKDGGGSGHW